MKTKFLNKILLTQLNLNTQTDDDDDLLLSPGFSSVCLGFCLLSPAGADDDSHRNAAGQGWAEVFLSPQFRNEIFPGDLLNLPGPTKKGLMLPLLFGAGLSAGLPSQISISSTGGGSDKCQINQKIIPISKIKKIFWLENNERNILKRFKFDQRFREGFNLSIFSIFQ